MSQVEFKKGQKVNAKTRSGVIAAGKVVGVIPGPRGSFVEVDHGIRIKRYRPSALTAA